MRKSANKLHTNYFWKDSCWFCLQCRKTICYFLWKNQENGCLENSIRARALKHRPVPNPNHFALAVYFACCSIDGSSLQRFRGQPYKQRKTHSRLSCFLSNTHTFAL